MAAVADGKLFSTSSGALSILLYVLCVLQPFLWYVLMSKSAVLSCFSSLKL